MSLASMLSTFILPRAETASNTQVWWSYARALLRAVQDDPVVGAYLPSSGTMDRANHLRGPEQAPSDLVDWGAAALATLDLYVKGGGDAGTILGQSMATTWSLEWDVIRGVLCHTYLHPVLWWVEHQAGSLPAMNRDIERWIQRIEWFGLSPGAANLHGVGDPPQELEAQESLFRFLFDSGHDLAGTSREVMTAEGRVDFLLRREQVMPVELKMWHGSDGFRNRPLAWRTQATDYAHDLRMRHAGLVVVCASRNQRLELDSALIRADGISIRGIQLHVRVADLGRHSSSIDGRKRTPVILRIEDLLPDHPA